MSYIEEIIATDNLYWAWEKAKWFYKPGDIWFDELEVSAFEANLDLELKRIHDEIKAGTYQLREIRPLAFPKSRNGEGPRTRQTFLVAVRDQVTWLAVMNAIGRVVDPKMPYWSYGNRLYISTFYEMSHDTNKPELKFGYYRNTTKFTYRKWNQSWPLYRRHINLTAKFLSGTTLTKSDRRETLDDRDTELIKVNDSLEKDHPLKVAYLSKGFWPEKLSGEIYWAGLDIQNFYPSVNLDVIKANLINCFENTGGSNAELIPLLNALLAFRLDTKGWSSEDLVQIKLSPTEKEYDHIPTGLFAGGFLANVAFLNVDRKINEKIKAHKNIAHFRFVDDHVIIATSFEDLVAWIEGYKKIISEENLNLEFNEDKVEPEALKSYLKDSENEEKKNAAKNASKLDPDFPSPLMTQTLMKVSQIANTEFQLLDHDEEKSLIADLEHLLLTEFPDQELRRDTRVSFAARMLSSLVPKLTLNDHNVYELELKLITIKEEAEKSKIQKILAVTKAGLELELKLIATKEEVEKSKIQEILAVAKADLELELKHIATKEETEKSKIQKILATAKANLEREETLISNHTLKLLLKAVRENHEKVRLWTRLLEFNMKSGHSNVKSVFSEISHLIKERYTNDLSVTFIKALILQVVTELVAKAFLIVQSTTSSVKSKRRSQNFLDDILNESFFDLWESYFSQNAKFYEKVTYDSFKFVSGTVIYLSKESGKKNFIEKYKLIDWEKDPNSFCLTTDYSFSIWAWWIIFKLPANSDNIEHPLWQKILPHIKIQNEVDRSVVQLYPRFLTPEILSDINLNKALFDKNEGWLFDLWQEVKNEEHCNNFSLFDDIKRKSEKVDGKITLYDWIEWTHNRNKELSSKRKDSIVFDPRLGEWMALEIIKNVANALDTEINKYRDVGDVISYYLCIHPNNFLLDSILIQRYETLTWDQLYTITQSKPIELRSREELVYDNRFVPSFGDAAISALSNQKDSMINALGELLICLLSKEFKLPNLWNPIGHQKAWQNIAKRNLRNIAVSSFTRGIIDGCFSKRNKETSLFKHIEILNGMDSINDTLYDPPNFIDVKEFIKHVSICQKHLKKQQLSVMDHQPRQLIPISLKQMNASFYQEQIEQDES